MIFEICAYDKITEDLKFVFPVPLGHFEELRVIMNWVRPEDKLFVYDLTHSQIIQIENMMNRNFYDPECDFQISSHLAD